MTDGGPSVAVSETSSEIGVTVASQDGFKLLHVSRVAVVVNGALGVDVFNCRRSRINRMALPLFPIFASEGGGASFSITFFKVGLWGPRLDGTLLPE